MTNTVLVSGATGNVGTAVLEKARELHWAAKGISREKNKLDLSDWDATAEYIADGPEYDLIVMAHGVQNPCTFRYLNKETWSSVMDGNLSSSASLTAALARYDKVKRGGLVVYFSSIQATHPRSGRGAYAAAKAGIEALSLAAGTEWSGSKIRTVALRIGQMTDTMKNVTFTKTQVEILQEKIPLEWVRPSDIAKLVFALYEQPSLTTSVIDIASGHNISIW